MNVKEMKTSKLLKEYNDLTGKNIKKFATRGAGEEAVLKARAAARAIEQTNERARQIVMKSKTEEQMDNQAQKDLINEVLAEANEAEANEANEAEANEANEANEAEANEANEANEAEANEAEANEAEGEAEANEAEGEGGKKELTDAEKAERHEARSKSITETWARPEVKAARTSRAGALVEWTDSEGNVQQKEFDSVSKAFKALSLPISVHIGFRTKMRKDGTNTIKHGETGIEYKFTAVEKGRIGKTEEQKQAERDEKAAKKAAKEAEKAAKKAAKEAEKAAKATKASEEATEEAA